MSRIIKAIAAGMIVVMLGACSSGGATFINVSSVSLAGTWNGVLNSDNSGVSLGGTFSVILKQTTGATKFTGNFTFTSSTCYTGGTVEGTISNDSHVTMTLTDNAGTKITLEGDLSKATFTITGIYIASGGSSGDDAEEVVPVATLFAVDTGPDDGSPGTCSNDAGRFHLTFLG